MSLLGNLFKKISGDTDSTSEAVVNLPCSNCPSGCAYSPSSCDLCRPYKEKLIDAIYQVEHIDEFRAKYVVVDNVAQGTVTCPYCNGQSENPFICEYCGSKLQEDDGKIRVASANDIPNPILQAQDIIFERWSAVVAPNTVTTDNGDGFLSKVTDLLRGDTDEETNTQTLGNKMTEAEIRTVANAYSVSVADYLTGLDQGKYLTLSRKEATKKAEETAQAVSSTASSVLSGLGAIAGATALTSAISNTRTAQHSSYIARSTYAQHTQHPPMIENTPPRGREYPQQQPPMNRNTMGGYPQQQPPINRNTMGQQSPMNRNSMGQQSPMNRNPMGQQPQQPARGMMGQPPRGNMGSSPMMNRGGNGHGNNRGGRR